MADALKKAPTISAPDHFEASEQLARARACVDLVRHYLEYQRLEESLETRERVEGVKALPEGAFWPGELERDDVIRALYGAWSDIREAEQVIERDVAAR